MYSIGADPEIFLRSNSTGKFVTADGIVEGTKERPKLITGSHYETIQLDGLAAEFNTLAANTSIEFVGSIGRVMRHLEKVAKAKGCSLAIEPVADFESEYFSSLRPETLELGCNPDWNAWTTYPNPMPEGDRPYRTGSGHIHIGFAYPELGRSIDPYSDADVDYCCRIARQLDYYLGVTSLLWDKDDRRRSLYGQAGAFRPKPYGIEYRVMSNTWLKTKALQTFVFDTARFAMHDFFQGKIAEEKYGNLAQTIINTNQIDWFEQHGKLVDIELPFLGD